jgi:hypothetical protein
VPLPRTRGKFGGEESETDAVRPPCRNHASFSSVLHIYPLTDLVHLSRTSFSLRRRALSLKWRALPSIACHIRPPPSIPARSSSLAGTPPTGRSSPPSRRRKNAPPRPPPQSHGGLSPPTNRRAQTPRQRSPVPDCKSHLHSPALIEPISPPFPRKPHTRPCPPSIADPSARIAKSPKLVPSAEDGEAGPRARRFISANPPPAPSCRSGSVAGRLWSCCWALSV